MRKNRLCGRVKRRCPIFPWGCPQSIVRAEELNYRVRDGNGCTLFAIITGSPAHTDGSLDRTYDTTVSPSCQEFFRPDFRVCELLLRGSWVAGIPRLVYEEEKPSTRTGQSPRQMRYTKSVSYYA